MIKEIIEFIAKDDPEFLRLMRTGLIAIAIIDAILLVTGFFIEKENCFFPFAIAVLVVAVMSTVLMHLGLKIAENRKILKRGK